MRSTPLAAATTVMSVVLVLSGCSSAPSHDDLMKQFKIELSDGSADSSSWDELSSLLADHALEGECTNDLYHEQLRDISLETLYAWDTVCLLNFESSMSESQVNRAKDSILEETTKHITSSDAP